MNSSSEPNYKPGLVGSFELQFANLDDPTVAAETLVAMAARLEHKRDILSPELTANKEVRAILAAGLPEVFNKSIGLDAVAKMTSNDFLPSNGVNALLTPIQDLGNGISIRQHAVSGEVFLFPTKIPHRIFIKPYDATPKIVNVTPAQEGKDKYSRVKVSGVRKGKSVEEELVMPA